MVGYDANGQRTDRLSEPVGDAAQEDVYQIGIPLLPPALVQHGCRLIEGESATVGTVTGHRVKAIRDGDNTRTKRDLGPFQSIGIAGAIPALVVMTYHVDAAGKVRIARQQLCAAVRTRLDQRALLRLQGAVFNDDVVR